MRVHQGAGAIIRYLTLNVERAPFNNIAVRRALAYLMPRAAIASRVYRGTSSRCTRCHRPVSRGTSTRSPSLRPCAEHRGREAGAPARGNLDADADRGLVDADALR